MATTGERLRLGLERAGLSTTSPSQARHEITARVGDAEALDYSINGVAGQPLGEPGEVRDILMTPGNVRTLKVIRPKPAPE